MSIKAAEISAIIDNLRRIVQVISEYSRNAEKTTDLTGPQLWAIKLLANNSPVRVSELARQMYLHAATVVGILDRLELKGLVIRTRSIEDRRVVDVDLTERGKEFVAHAPEVAQVMLLKGLDELSDREFACVKEGMEHIVRILGAERIKPQPLHG